MKAKVKNARPIIKNNPIFGRLMAAVLILVAVFSWPVIGMRETFSDFSREIKALASVAFLPWEDHE